MAIRFYILPVEEYISPAGRLYRGPKYLQWRFGTGIVVDNWSMKDYGLEATAVVAVDGVQTDHDYLSGQPDVYQFPETLTTSLSPSDISEISGRLEASFVPSDWITPSDTFETCLRTILGMFMSMQRYHGITGQSIFESGIALNTQYRNWPQQEQDAFSQIWMEFGGDVNDIKSNWTARILLKNLADLWGDTPVIFGFVNV
jgi:hypothetical protein